MNPLKSLTSIALQFLNLYISMMSSRLLLICVLYFTSLVFQSLLAQTDQWQAMDKGLPGINTSATLWNDTLYATSLPDQYSAVLAKWNGSTWDSVAIMSTDMHFLLNKMLVFQDDLYILGYFEHINNRPLSKSIVRWDGTEFQSVGGGLEKSLLPNITSGLVYKNHLYITGFFSTVGDLPSASNLASWDGTQWYEELPDFKGNINGLLERNGELLAYGKIDSLNGQAVNANLIVRKEDEWVPIFANPEGLTCFSLGKCVSFVSQEKTSLWGFGNFLRQDTLAESVWSKLTDGGWDDSPNSAAPAPVIPNGFAFVSDTIPVCYGYASQFPATKPDLNHHFLLPYTQSQASALPSNLDQQVYWMIGKGDTLYAGGSFESARHADGSTVAILGGMARYIASKSTNRKPAQNLSFSHIDNGISKSLKIHLKETASGMITIYNAAGQRVEQQSIESGATDVETGKLLPAGLYHISLTQGQKSASFRWLKPG